MSVYASLGCTDDRNVSQMIFFFARDNVIVWVFKGNVGDAHTHAYDVYQNLGVISLVI